MVYLDYKWNRGKRNKRKEKIGRIQIGWKGCVVWMKQIDFFLLHLFEWMKKKKSGKN